MMKAGLMPLEVHISGYTSGANPTHQRDAEKKIREVRRHRTSPNEISEEIGILERSYQPVDEAQRTQVVPKVP